MNAIVTINIPKVLSSLFTLMRMYEQPKGLG